MESVQSLLTRTGRNACPTRLAQFGMESVQSLLTRTGRNACPTRGSIRDGISCRLVDEDRQECLSYAWYHGIDITCDAGVLSMALPPVERYFFNSGFFKARIPATTI